MDFQETLGKHCMIITKYGARFSGTVRSVQDHRLMIERDDGKKEIILFSLIGQITIED